MTLYVLARARVEVNKGRGGALFQVMASTHSPRGLDHCNLQCHGHFLNLTPGLEPSAVLNRQICHEFSHFNC